MKTPRDRVIEKLGRIEAWADVVSYDVAHTPRLVGPSYFELRRKTRRLGKALRRWRREQTRVNKLTHATPGEDE